MNKSIKIYFPFSIQGDPNELGLGPTSGGIGMGFGHASPAKWQARPDTSFLFSLPF